MRSSFHPDSINYAEFTDILSRYPALVASLSRPSSSKRAGAAIHSLDTLEELDEYRVQVVSAELAKLDKKYLTKEQVEWLIKWKLKRGKWRPRLANLVSSNSPTTIEGITRDAFALHFTKPQDLQPVLNVLTRLSGIGPASASLLLSVYDPDNVPFFSDEAFRWVSWEEGKGKGWDRKINYNDKEYSAFVGAVQRARKRLEAESEGKSIGAGEVERVGWVIAKEEEQAALDKRNEGERDLRMKFGGKEMETALVLPAPKGSAKGSTKQSDTGKKTQKRKPPKEIGLTSAAIKEDALEPRRSKRVRNS